MNGKVVDTSMGNVGIARLDHLILSNLITSLSHSISIKFHGRPIVG